MSVKICCPLWGQEHLELITFLDRVRTAGFDGVETWLPSSAADQLLLTRYLHRHGMLFIAHQHEAEGRTFQQFCASFAGNLQKCAALEPVLINSHTGKDYFTVGQNLQLIDIAAEFTAKTGIRVLHETHRGRLGYSPQAAVQLFRLRHDMRITADFSHWVCVTESMLDNFTGVMDEAIKRTGHVHARVGFEQGPQIPDPRAPEWAGTVERFLQWWDRIGADVTFTTEFGPEPYMPRIPRSKAPMVNQFEVNCYMKQLLRARFSTVKPAR